MNDRKLMHFCGRRSEVPGSEESATVGFYSTIGNPNSFVLKFERDKRDDETEEILEEHRKQVVKEVDGRMVSSVRLSRNATLMLLDLMASEPGLLVEAYELIKSHMQQKQGEENDASSKSCNSPEIAVQC